MKLPTFSDIKTETPSLALFVLGREFHRLAGAKCNARKWRLEQTIT
jgi:hypothetical protein